MQIETGELIALWTAAATALGAGIRHFAPLVFKKNFWKYSNNITESLRNNRGTISFTEHTALCEPIKKQLSEAAHQFKMIRDQNDHISNEVRWLRALSVVQAPPEAIKKADEITGAKDR
jgi:predicted oxidoreductase (fatty acid repression mutant protein)